jgi:DNA primase
MLAEPLPGEMSAEDAHRAARVLAMHVEALAPALATVRTNATRQHVALAFARRAAGEIGHWACIETLERLKGQ